MDSFPPPINLTGEFEIVADGVGVIIVVHEVIACVVWRVDVDHLDLTVVVLLEHLEHFEVVTLNEHVLSSVPVNRLLFVGHKRCRGGGLGGANGVALARPRQTKSLAAFLYVYVENRLESVEINLAVGYNLRKEFCEFVRGFGCEVWCGLGDFVDRVCHGVLRSSEN